MLGPFRNRAKLPDEVRSLFERALERLGVTVTRWKGATAIAQRRDKPLEINVAAHLEVLDSRPERTPRDGLAIYLSSRLGLPLPDELALDLRIVRPWLRARVLHPRVLEGPSRAMCRREAFSQPGDEAGSAPPQTDLITAVSIGGAGSVSFVTTRSLDAWDLTFEEVLLIGTENIRSLLTPDDLSEVSGPEPEASRRAKGADQSKRPTTAGVLAVIDSTGETGAAASLVLESLLPDADPASGLLFSVPADDATLVLPVIPGAGAASLAGLVQATYALAAEREHPLSEQVFWRRKPGGGAARTVKVPMTSIHEGGSRRVHLEADGVVEELLKILGEIE